jgi:hypothetical protein
MTIDLAGNEVREHWTQLALEALPPESCVLERNLVISAMYAQWYLDHGETYKWAGVAAFASHRVGLALSPYEFIVDNEVVDVMDEFGRRRGSLLADLNLIRETNNMVYRDMGWTHLAYASVDGGLSAVEKGLSDLPSHYRLVDGFRLIDEGRKLIDRGRIMPGREAIWRGNELLLEHEQYCTVQPQFEKLDRGFDTFLTVATMLDFDADNLRIEWSSNTSFFAFMWTRGMPLLLRTVSPPDIRRVDHRWYWVANRVYPLWKQVDQSDRNLRLKLTKLARKRNWQTDPRASSAIAI